MVMMLLQSYQLDMESQSYFIFFLRCSSTKSTVDVEQRNRIP